MESQTKISAPTMCMMACVALDPAMHIIVSPLTIA